MAILLWHAISATDVSSTSLDAALVVTTDQDVYLRGVPEKVKLHVRGPANKVEKLSRGPGRVFARYRLRREMRTSPVESVHIRSLADLDFDGLPQEVDVVGASPDQLEFQVEDLIERYVRVRPRFTGRTAEGFELVEPVPVDPSEVVVRGHFSLLEEVTKVGYLETRPIPLTGRRGSDEWQTFYLDLMQVPETASPLGAGMLTCEEPMVKVHLLIRPQVQERVIQGVAILVMIPADFPFRVELKQARCDVCIRGPEVVLREVRPEDLRLFVDLGAVREVGKQEVLPEVKLPDGVQLARPLDAVSVVVFRNPQASPAGRVGEEGKTHGDTGG
ncbi:MAG: hypothetical protein HYU36_18620 [Planctomycetes bacterium]|nr:hypothetical protein [Planctomycetota bacterium]